MMNSCMVLKYFENMNEIICSYVALDIPRYIYRNAYDNSETV